MDNAGENKQLVKRLNSKNWQLYPKIEYTARDMPQHNHLGAVFSALGYPAGDSITANLERASLAGGSVPASLVVARYETILAEADSRLGEAFNILPASELIVVGGQAGGFYVRPSRDGTRPGAFHAANTSAEPAYLMKSLAYHEGVPGHHLQIALAQERGESLVQQSINFTVELEGGI